MPSQAPCGGSAQKGGYAGALSARYRAWIRMPFNWGFMSPSRQELRPAAVTHSAVQRLYNVLDRDVLQRHSAEWIRMFLASCPESASEW